MKNLLNIEDKVKITMPGTIGDGVIVEVNSMQKWPDGKILYVGIYHQECPNGGQGYDSSIQFGEGQYSRLDKKVK